MLDINELIRELAISVKEIIFNNWNLLTTEEKESEYSNLISAVTVATIENFNLIDLESALHNIENELKGITPNKERCKLIAKKLTEARNSHHAKLIFKGRRERREKMNKAIKEIAIPFIRSKGFKGSFPNFKIESKNQKIKLQFQFSQFSSQFIVELTSSKIGKDRLRLGSNKHQKDYWYDFEQNNSENDIFKLRAHEVVENWDEAEEWIEK